MPIASQVLKNYQKRPYPSIGRFSPRRAQWRLPPMEWINAVWQPAQPVPERILVAGCGTGNEAFAFRDRFPDSEIVALDFSPHSIALARKSQRRRGSREKKIRFAVCDLTATRFQKIAPRRFDLASCHGVLSYVPQADKALKNISRCVASTGIFYLGVNGAGHFSRTWRKVLPAFGIETNRMRQNSGLPNIVKLLDTISDANICAVAEMEPAFLSGDLFGPLNRALPLRDWTKMARRADLHLLASEASSLTFRAAINNESFGLLMPRSRTDLALLLDSLQPVTFHRLLFAVRKPVRPPWNKTNELLNWRPLLVPHLRNRRWPRHRGRWETLRTLEIRTVATNTVIELRVAEWLLEILRHSDGHRSVRQILRAARAGFDPALLRQQLYLLHHLEVLNLAEPL